MSARLRVALYHAFGEDELFGVRRYGEDVARALDGRCDVVHVRPWPRRSPIRSRALTTVMKRVVYPREARRIAADVHHVLDHSHADLVDALPAAATVVTCHDLFPLLHGPSWRRVLFRRRVEKLRRAAAVIAVSRATAEAARRELALDPAKLHVVPNRLDRFFLETPDADEVASASHRLDLPEGRFCLHVGASHAYKNLEGLIEALARVRPATPLVKVGARLTRTQRRLARARGVAVREIGERRREDLRAVYHRAALLAQPSWDEGFGWPVAEAMACGLPVVVSGVPALAEVTDGAGYTVAPDDTQAIAEAIETLLGDPSLAAARAERGRQRAAELCRGDFAADVLAVYASVTGCAS